MTVGHEPNAELLESRTRMAAGAVEVPHDVAVVTLIDADEVPLLRMVPPSVPAHSALLHFHGGGFRTGSPRAFAGQVARIAQAVGVQTFGVQYRLAPENPYPAGLDDAVTAYRWLLDSGFEPAKIIVWGDSAGGGLASALLLRLAQQQIPLPGGAVLLSPWVDLRVDTPSYDRNAATDDMFSAARATKAAADYLAGQEPAQPLVSPVLGDWSGQPPLLILSSDSEVLSDDADLLAATASAAGVEVRIEKFRAARHIWPIMEFPATPNSTAAVGLFGAFVESRLAAPLPRP